MDPPVELLLVLFGLCALGAVVGTTASWAAMIRLRKYHRATWEALGGMWWDHRLLWYFWRRRHKELADPALDTWATLTVAGQVMAVAAWLAFFGLVIWSVGAAS